MPIRDFRITEYLDDGPKVVLPTVEPGHDSTIISMGPQHPSTHGVLRMMLRVDGETVLRLVPVIGYLHRGIEKMAEARTYAQVVPYMDRLDYLSSMSMGTAWCLAVERLAGIEAPPRAKYLRTIVGELQRLASHLIWLGTFGLDLGAVTAFIYTFREREYVLELFEALCGGRLTYNYSRIGGVMADIPAGWVDTVRAYLTRQEAGFTEYDRLLTDNPVFRARTEGVGRICAADAVNYGLSGPCLRATGVSFDVRTAAPYDAYGEVTFQVATATEGDCFARYLVRFAEMRESVKIVRQCLDALPEGEVQAKVPRVIKPPVGEVYSRIEAPRGDFGVFVVSDGSANPARARFRSPSFANLSALEHMSRGMKVADIVAILGSLDIVLGEIDR